MNAMPFPAPRPEGDILSRVFPAVGCPLPGATWEVFKESFEFYAEAVTFGEILIPDPSLDEVDRAVVDAVGAMQAGAPVVRLGKVVAADLVAQNLTAPEAFRVEPGLHFVLAYIQEIGSCLTVYRGGLDGHYLRSATMFTINTLGDDPEGARGLVPVGHVHLYAGPKTRPFRTPILIADDCPERVVIGFLRTVVQLKMLADAGGPRRKLRPPRAIRRGEMILASRDGWVLACKSHTKKQKDWVPVRLYRTEASPKVTFSLCFNRREDRLARNSELTALEERHPEIKDWAYKRVREWNDLFAP